MQNRREMTCERPYPGSRQAGRRQQGRLGLRERASEAGRGADFGLTPAPLETRVSLRAPVASHSSSYTHGARRCRSDVCPALFACVPLPPPLAHEEVGNAGKKACKGPTVRAARRPARRQPHPLLWSIVLIEHTSRQFYFDGRVTSESGVSLTAE